MFKKTANIIINGKKHRVKKTKPLLTILKNLGIDIPTLCFHPDSPVHANCRMCIVEIENHLRLEPACATLPCDGMKIKSHSPRVIKARKLLLEYIFGEHVEKCDTCLWNKKCRLLTYAKEYKVNPKRFKDRKSRRPTFIFGKTIILDTRKCIECRNCVDTCKNQGIGFLEIDRKGFRSIIKPDANPKNDCIYCGQCINHCPVGAIHGRGEIEEVLTAINNKKIERKLVVAQTAPSIRVAIGEEFNMGYGRIATGQLVSALRTIGFDKVFDVNTGADFTTYEEAREFAQRVKKGGPFPMFTTCCPAWYKYVEQKYPQYIPYCTSARSPNMMNGAVIKQYYSKLVGLKPKDIHIVAIMPCTAKKYEIRRKELNINGIPPVDNILTTRELACMLKLKKINLKKMPLDDFDSPVGKCSGAADIYGATGGVMESALRSAYFFVTGKELKNVNFKSVRGSIKGIKKTIVKIGKLELKIAVTNGLGHAGKIIEELKHNPKAYHYVEVMTCPGGCVAGGGQPMPINDYVRKQRARALYKIDRSKKIRRAHHNKSMLDIYRNFFDKKKGLAHKLLHTNYKPKTKVELETITCALNQKKCVFYEKL